jgi:hypothetical protein
MSLLQSYNKFYVLLLNNPWNVNKSVMSNLHCTWFPKNSAANNLQKYVGLKEFSVYMPYNIKQHQYFDFHTNILVTVYLLGLTCWGCIW